MESDVFYGAIKTNDYFHGFEPKSEQKNENLLWAFGGIELIMLSRMLLITNVSCCRMKCEVRVDLILNVPS